MAFTSLLDAALVTAPSPVAFFPGGAVLVGNPIFGGPSTGLHIARQESWSCVQPLYKRGSEGPHWYNCAT